MGGKDTKYHERQQVIICDDLGCAYRWNNEYKELEWCPLMQDGTLDIDSDGQENWGCVDEDIVGDETVTYKGKEVTLSDVYRDVEKELGVSK